MSWQGLVVESDGGPGMAEEPPINVPELRDYQQINAELVRRLNLGQRRVRLEAVEGQRLLVSRLAGSWQAVVEIDGNAGPELAADLDAPGLVVVCHGTAADGAGRGLRAGRLILLERCGTAVGYFQQGGLILARADVGPRAGLNQQGGDLILLGRSGALTGERQTGGRLFLQTSLTGADPGFGARGGRQIHLPADGPLTAGLDPADRLVLEQAIELAGRYASTT